MRRETARRIKALNVLTRLREQEIDHSSGELRRLQNAVEAIRKERGQLQLQLEENERVNTLEGGFLLARYTRNVRSRMALLHQKLSEITPRLLALEERIRDLYLEAKTYESLELELRLSHLHQCRRLEEKILEEMYLARMAGNSLRAPLRT